MPPLPLLPVARRRGHSGREPELGQPCDAGLNLHALPSVLARGVPERQIWGTRRHAGPDLVPPSDTDTLFAVRLRGDVQRTQNRGGCADICAPYVRSCVGGQSHAGMRRRADGRRTGVHVLSKLLTFLTQRPDVTLNPAPKARAMLMKASPSSSSSCYLSSFNNLV